MPPDTPLRDLKSFLTTVLEEMTVQRRKAQALKGLLLAEHLQVCVCVCVVCVGVCYVCSMCVMCVLVCSVCYVCSVCVLHMTCC